MTDGKISVRGYWLKIASFDDEYIRDVKDPEAVLRDISGRGIKADLLTFWQRVPDAEPHFPYYFEWEDQAVLKIESYDDWFHNKANRKARQAVTRAVRRGVSVKVMEYDDEFIDGITEVMNETPIRQGRPYIYYGMSREQIAEEYKEDIDRSILLASYLEGKIIGFIKLGVEGQAAVPFGMISMVKHLDKCPQNLLLAEGIRTCEQHDIPYFWYGTWHEGGLGKFKIYNGFSKFAVPRYYIPITWKGKLAIKLRLHHGIREMLPQKWRNKLRNLRESFYRSRLK